MSIKIISGEAKGVTLSSPSSLITRPTSVLLKRRVFDAYQSIEQFMFIDLCAGIGGVGLEALSRGVRECILIEKDTRALSQLKKNAKLVSSKIKKNNYQVIKSDIFLWLESFQKEYELLSPQLQATTIIFFDPPYEKLEMYQKIKNILSWFKGILFVEACRQKTMHENKLQELLFEAHKCYRQGSSYIIVGDFRAYD